MGRYLLLGSSGAPGALPPNLQGLWAEGAKPPWGCDFHLNINLQMAYWPALPTALSETLAPALRPFLARLAASGEVAARSYYGVEGGGEGGAPWVAHGFVDAWALAAPLGPPMWSYCVTCGAWAALLLWESFEFSRSAKELRALWPLLHGATAFFLALLRQRNGIGDDGTPLQWGPSHSPENAWMDGAGATHF